MNYKENFLQHLLLLSVLLVAFSCSDNEVSPGSTEKNIYTAGQSFVDNKWLPTYYKNGVPTTIGNEPGYINALCVSNGTLYAAGSILDRAAYWVGETAHYVFDAAEDGESYVYDMLVEGGNIHLLAYKYANGSSSYYYIKNNTRIALTGVTSIGTINSLMFDGTDVYVLALNSQGMVTIKNGTTTTLISATGYPSSIYRYNNDIYIAGVNY